VLVAFTPVELERNVAVQTNALPSTVSAEGAEVSEPAVALEFDQVTVEEEEIRFPPYSTRS